MVLCCITGPMRDGDDSEAFIQQMMVDEDDDGKVDLFHQLLNINPLCVCNKALGPLPLHPKSHIGTAGGGGGGASRDAGATSLGPTGHWMGWAEEPRHEACHPLYPGMVSMQAAVLSW